MEPFVIGERTLSEQCRVLRSDEGKVDNRRNDRVLSEKAQRHGAERETMQEVNRAIDGVEHPKQPVAGRLATLLFSQELNLWRLVVEEVTNAALHRQVNF